MKTAITTTAPAQIAVMNDLMQQAGQAANQQAVRVAFADHTARKANNTIFDGGMPRGMGPHCEWTLMPAGKRPFIILTILLSCYEDGRPLRFYFE